jgi:hypothetical protein
LTTYCERSTLLDMETPATSPVTRTTLSTFDVATERHFQAWLDSYAHDDERAEVEAAVRRLVAIEPGRLESESWREMHRAALATGDAAAENAARHQQVADQARREEQQRAAKEADRKARGNQLRRERNQAARDLGMRKTRYGWE